MAEKGHIRVVTADPHRLFRAGLRLILSAEDGVEVVGEAADMLETVEVISSLQPDVLLLAFNLPGIDVTESFASIKRRSPKVKLLMLTPTEDESFVFKGLKAGGKGCVSKDARPCDLVRAIRAVHRGELWVERGLIAEFVEMEAIANGTTKDHFGRTEGRLTGREQEILRVLASGGTNREIAQALFISEKTVKCHLNNIFRKLHVTRRLQAVLYAVRSGVG